MASATVPLHKGRTIGGLCAASGVRHRPPLQRGDHRGVVRGERRPSPSLYKGGIIGGFVAAASLVANASSTLPQPLPAREGSYAR